MLADKDIKSLLASRSEKLASPLSYQGDCDWNQVPLTDTNWDSRNSPIQPSSLDLRVGRIYVPGAKPGHLGSHGHGAASQMLSPGASVIVSTFEEIKMPADLGGIVFPPSELSSKGVLVANIGHIDPGFCGHLRFTIINMGAKPLALERGRDIVGTLLIFRLSTSSNAPWSSRRTTTTPKGEPDQLEIDTLSPHFADIDARVRRLTGKIARRTLWRFGLWVALIPIVFGSASVMFALSQGVVGRLGKIEGDIVDLRVQLARRGALDEARTASPNAASPAPSTPAATATAPAR